MGRGFGLRSRNRSSGGTSRGARSFGTRRRQPVARQSTSRPRQTQQTQQAQQPRESVKVSSPQARNEQGDAQRANNIANSFRPETSSAGASASKDSAAPSTNSAAPSQTGAAGAEQKESIGSDLFKGFSQILGGDNPLKTLTNATKPFEFDDKERKVAESGLDALTKMAGKDGVLTPDDRGNIVGQMDDAIRAEKNRTVSGIANQKIAQAKADRGPLRKALFPNAPLVSKVGARKKQEALRDPAHMQTARNQAVGQLNQGLKELGMDTSGPVNLNQGRQNAQGMPDISLQDTKNFESTMKMIQSKAKEMGLPEGKFEKGLPVKFLEDVLSGRPAMTLRQHQVNPFGN